MAVGLTEQHGWFAHFPITEPKRREIHGALLANAGGKP